MSRRHRPRPIPAYTDLLLARSGWSLLCCACCVVLVVGFVVALRDDNFGSQLAVIAAGLGTFAGGVNAVLWHRCRRSVLSTDWREGTGRARRS